MCIFIQTKYIGFFELNFGGFKVDIFVFKVEEKDTMNMLLFCEDRQVVWSIKKFCSVYIIKRKKKYCRRQRLDEATHKAEDLIFADKIVSMGNKQ